MSAPVDVLAILDAAARALWVEGQPVNPHAADLIRARAAVAELIAAIKTVNELHPLGDAIYQVRESIDWTAEPFDGRSWDHPRVKRYSDAVETVKAALLAIEPAATVQP